MFNNILGQLQNNKDLQKHVPLFTALLSNCDESKLSIQDQFSTAADQFQDIESKLQSISSAKQDISDTASCTQKVSNCHSFQYLANILKKYKQHAESNINILDVMKSNHHNKSSQQKPISTNHSGDAFGVCLLNEYHHLLYQHQDEFENIFNLLTEKIYATKCCKVSKCISMRRHHRDRLNTTEIDLYDESNLLEQQILDMIYCYFIHSFDIGCRLTNCERVSICDEKQANENQSDIGQVNMKLMQKMISAKKNQYKQIGDEKKSDEYSTKFVTMQYSNGVRFYYWPFYKNKNERFDPAASVPIKQHTTQDLETLGYWYIEKKYDNFKEEMLNNEICVLSEQDWNNITQRVAIDSQTNHAREIICLRNESLEYYKIKTGQTIQSKHLIALKIYTNFDKLQRKFSETFRKLSKNDTDLQLKDRHKNYYFLGKNLRECVECFGMKCRDMKLYHGIQKECNFSSVYPYFKGPFSTTKEYSVALTFGNFNGMILQLKVGKDAWKQTLDISNDQMNCFDCCWVSRYPSEQEILFLGGLNRHTFGTIINLKTGVNYYRYITAIRQMTYSTSNWSVPLDMLKPDKPTDVHKQMVFRLLSHEFYRYEKYRAQSNLAYEFKGCPEYIKKLLHKHCCNVKAIVFGEKLYPKSEKQNFIFKQFFQLDNEWADLERLTTVFPQIELIGFQFENVFAIQRALEITYKFIKNNTDIPLRLIVVKVEGNDSEGKGKVIELVKKLANKFKDLEIKWNLRVRNIDDNLIDSTVRDLQIKETKFIKEIQKFKNKQTKLMQALKKGLIIDIKKA